MTTATRPIEIWIEGYAVTGGFAPAQHVTTIEAGSFEDAMLLYLRTLDPTTRGYWASHPDGWRCWGCRAFDNEADARKLFG